MHRSVLSVGAVVVGATLLAPAGSPLGLGIAPAAAAQGYHTRKKVNGRWVTGKFANGRAAQTTAAEAPATPAEADTPATGAVPIAAPAAKGSRRVRFTERKGLAKARYASLPKLKAKVVLKTDAKDAVPVPPPAPPAQLAAIRPPAGAAGPMPPDRVLATASINPAPVVHPGAERMRSALEARARTMASLLGVVTIALPDPAPAVQLSARSVTFDLERGTRTVVFEDGVSATAPFDKGRAGDLTGVGAPSR